MQEEAWIILTRKKGENITRVPRKTTASGNWSEKQSESEVRSALFHSFLRERSWQTMVRRARKGAGSLAERILALGTMDSWADGCALRTKCSLRRATGNVLKKRFAYTPSCNYLYMFRKFSFSLVQT